MEAGLPDVDTEYNVDGRAAHAYAADMLAYWLASPGATFYPGYTQRSIRVALKAGGHVDVPLTQAMKDAVEVYFDYVVSALNEAPAGARLLVEQRLTLDAWSPPEPMFGTGDAVIVSDDPAYIHVIDFKYGTGVVVEVQDNPQLLEYAGAAAGMFLEPGTLVPPGAIKTTIVQPRAEHADGPIRTAEYDWSDVLAFTRRLLARAKDAGDPNAPLTPGPWCRWCKAAGHCPALYEVTQRAAQVDFEVPGEAGGDKPAPKEDNSAGVSLAPRDLVPEAEFEVLPPDPERLPLAVAVAVLDKAAIVEAFLAGVRERVRREIAAGAEVPGWKIVAARPVREWADEAAVKHWAAIHGIGLWELSVQSLRSPAQVEKIAKARGLKVPEELWTKTSKSEKLVPADDKRPALPTNAQREFEALPPASGPSISQGGGKGTPSDTK